MTFVKVKCSNCGKEFNKPLGEYNRRIKKGSIDFYCSSKCAGQSINAAKKKPDIEKECPVCHKKFITTTKAKGATYCSRSCASKGSVNEARKEAGRKTSKLNFKPASVETIVNVLKKREAWKYKELKDFLDFKGEQYEFEYKIDNYIYDLVLFNKKIIIEFDGKEHKYYDETDKNFTAISNGYKLYRIDVQPSSIIHPSVLYQFLI
jgi:hypothetical protein